MSYVDANTESIRSTGQETLEVASETKAIVNSLRGDLDNLSPIWSGTDQGEFVKMAYEKTDTINKLLERLERAGESLVSSAGGYEKQSEEFASGLRNNSFYEEQ